MIYYSHRANLFGPTSVENSICCINQSINKGFSVEIDVWLINKTWFLGHDRPIYSIELQNILDLYEYLLIHAKNIMALDNLRQYSQLHVFWHEQDQYTFSSQGKVIVYPGKPLIKNCICMKPELYKLENLQECYGICSDYIGFFKNDSK